MPRVTRSAVRNSQRPTLPKGRTTATTPPRATRPPLTFIPADRTDVDDAENKKFKPLQGRELITERSRRVSAEALKSASARMRGPLPDEVDESDDNYGEEVDEETEDEAEAEVEPNNDDGDGDVPPPTPAELAARLFSGPSLPDTHTTLPQQPEPPRSKARAARERNQATTTELTPPQQSQAQQQPQPSLVARTLSVADVDRLWDWIRQDGDHGQTLFGRVMQSSLDLHQAVHAFAQNGEQWAMIRALDVNGALLGFVTLNPILVQERTAVVTIYLAPDARTNYVALLPHVLGAVTNLSSLHLAFPAFDAQWAEMYRRALAPIGFTEHTLFVR